MVIAIPQAPTPPTSAPPALDPGIDLDWLSRKIDYRLYQDCVHCGLCTASCPTYLETGNENDSPRGRIYLMRAVTDGRLGLGPGVREHLDLCLDCRACESACPSGVQYGKLIEPCEVVVPRAQACCGAIHYHSGVEEPALELARRNLAAFDPARFDAIIVNAAGCGAMLKDYAHLLPGADHEAAGRFVAKVRDISEFLVDLGPVRPSHPLPMKVTYHDPCHLCHAQQVRAQPRQLL